MTLSNLAAHAPARHTPTLSASPHGGPGAAAAIRGGHAANPASATTGGGAR